MSKKIGFRSYQNDEEPDKQDELEKQQAERQKAIANFIGQNYSPIGTTSQKCYKTTAELVYELSNIVDVAPMALAKQLADAGYHVVFLWLLVHHPVGLSCQIFYMVPGISRGRNLNCVS